MKLTEINLLKQMIEAKEAECELERRLLKAHLHITYQSLKPLNILRSTVKEIISTPEHRSSILSDVITFLTTTVVRKFTGSKS